MTEDMFRFADSIGPAKIVHIHVPGAGLKSVVAIDNVAAGPAIGGVRMAPDVSAEEAFRLGRAMTMKNAAAGLPHGGGKSVIFADPKAGTAEKERLIRAFAVAIRNLIEYIPGPDMGTDETCMAWIQDEIGRSVGLPREIGGIPLDEIGATGFGVAAAAEVAQEFCDVKLVGARVAIQGFGSVGKHAARFLADKGAILVAAADSTATVSDPAGLPIADLIAAKANGKRLAETGIGTVAEPDAVVGIACDIWIPAARPDVLRGDNVARLDARLVVQGANIPVTAEAEAALHRRGILSVPDFIANAGGVICASVEYHGGHEHDAFGVIDAKIRTNTRQTLERAAATGDLPRAAAMALAAERVERAMAMRRTF